MILLVLLSLSPGREARTIDVECIEYLVEFDRNGFNAATQNVNLWAYRVVDRGDWWEWQLRKIHGLWMAELPSDPIRGPDGFSVVVPIWMDGDTHLVRVQARHFVKRKVVR